VYYGKGVKKQTCGMIRCGRDVEIGVLLSLFWKVLVSQVRAGDGVPSATQQNDAACDKNKGSPGGEH
jgi:hypothetical protein